METLPQALAERLKEPLPKEAIAAHPTKGFLSTIKTIYQVERLNEVFGIGGWSAKSEIIEHESPMIIMRVTLKVPAYGIDLEQYGGNDNPDRGDAYKGAFTDALSKICGYLGIGMDVYKGDGPTKGNPNGKPQSNWREERERKGQEAKDRMAQRAAEQAVPPNARYVFVDPDGPIPEPPDGLLPPHAEQLRDSVEPLRKDIKEFGVRPTKKSPDKIQLMKAFAGVKKLFKEIDREDAYYRTLGAYGAVHSSDFPDTPGGIKQGRECYKEMSLAYGEAKAEEAKKQEQPAYVVDDDVPF